MSMTFRIISITMNFTVYNVLWGTLTVVYGADTSSWTLTVTFLL